ncbi:m-AAA protease-interacting protein 1, mitochondrial [Nematolebias whitei]|uniref:m-AAA protease-interacting protein 1, mitochondrial n=1 Tax=Nematolebias whitei TaxID=451745 RepID=UPI00189AD390|nr:m-AAA protease-interacting protein 1, mitochondrial [Nematolebias whitei]
MALSLLRCCSRLNPTFSFTRSVLNQNVVLNRFCKTRLRGSIPEGRFCSSQEKTKIFELSFMNPIRWLRTRINCFLIRIYFDKEFSVEEFTEGATQAFSHVSGLLSRCQFEALEGLVDEDLIEKLAGKCCFLSSSHKEALSANPDDILFMILRDVRIFYDNERKFVRILMHFWYVTSAWLPGEIEFPRSKFFKRDDENETTERILEAIYEFQKEFTQGAPSDWTITRIEHSKFLP